MNRQAACMAGLEGAVTDPVFIGLGSNLGDSRQILLKAWRRLGDFKEIETVILSDPFLTSPVGMNSSHWFVNAVGRLKVSCSPEQLLEYLQLVETDFGRIRKQESSGYQDRTVDLDLLYFDSVVSGAPRLTLPHPHRTERLFVLTPLASIAPGFMDPEYSAQTVSDLLDRLRQRIDSKQVAEQEIIASSWSGQL